MEEWRQCGRWLIDCKVLPPNHRVVWPSAVVFELAQALRDGVLLCQLLHNLSPGSIDLKDINFRPQMSQVIIPDVHPYVLMSTCGLAHSYCGLEPSSPLGAGSGSVIDLASLSTWFGRNEVPNCMEKKYIW